MSEITLVAMAPAGDILVVRDRSGQVWVYPPEGAGEPRIVDSALADRAIATHDLERIERTFPSWIALDDYLRDRVATLPSRLPVDRSQLDVEDIRELLAVMREWVNQGNGPDAQRLGYELLRVPALIADQALLDELASLLQVLAQPQLPRGSEPKTDLQRSARKRWEQVKVKTAA